MTLEEANKAIQQCSAQMQARYGTVVFDEWAVVSVKQRKAGILAYVGPRNDDFLKNFANDLGALRSELAHARHGVGDFEFTRHGVGTLFEAFLVLGDGLFLICNNTTNSMDGLTKKAEWIDAQIPFVELSDKFRSNPVVCAA